MESVTGRVQFAPVKVLIRWPLPLTEQRLDELKGLDMGDFADMALSETMDMEDLRFEYRMGGMSDFDAYDHGIIDERGFYQHRPMFGSAGPVSKTCRHCGTTGLGWKSTPSGWRLASGGVVHRCADYRATYRPTMVADEFKVLDAPANPFSDLA